MHHKVRRLVSFVWVVTPLVSAVAASSFVAAGCSKDGVTPGSKVAESLAAEALASKPPAALPSLVLSRFPSTPVKRAGRDELAARQGPLEALRFGARVRGRTMTAPSLESLGNLGFETNDGSRGDGSREEGCPQGMANINGRFCIDRYEASLVELLPNGEERDWSPFTGMEGHVVRALSRSGVLPQGYISGEQATEACGRSGKRLCGSSEWKTACKGSHPSTFGYGASRERGRCNDNGRAPMGLLFGRNVNLEERTHWNWERMNDPALNQVPGTLAQTGAHEGCTNDFGVFDMVGNLHEWVADPNGTFQGGYYLDTNLNGDGCEYRTTAHDFSYHDYSTGFRCCADPEPT